jgi:translation initiation factor IF-2
MMNVSVTEVISTCMNLGLFVSINQRLDAETMALVADEFAYKVEFVSVEVQEAIAGEEDKEEDLIARPPIVTVMGHVDHGKTKLLDYIRSANVVAGEAGGITQHIGAYSVELEDGKRITFLDTPGHEAFTAMRARGAQVTDVAIIVVAADDGIMPQTKEAINHAAAAGVPIVFAINKVDKPSANPDKIKEELAQMNYMVEEWGGKYQSQDISALKGLNIKELLEKVLLEAEMLDLKANPNKKAIGSIIESELDKGRGYVSTVLVEAGTLRIGDVVLAGSYYGHVKAMFNERGKKVTEVGPATPVQILGLNGAPPSGDNFNVMDGDAEARNIANKREQLGRQQSMRTQKHITLDEIGRRLAIGNFQELNVIIKGDVDGSIEALTDSLVKLSTEEIQVNVIHKAVGEISESDVMLANASNAIIIGFQVRPSLSARKLAEKEEIEIRLYSIIYDAINELKDAMSGMLSPEIKEEIVATIEVRETFKITKVGTIAGCMVKEGKIHRNTKIRLIRDGIVIYTGALGSLKRFKDDVKEVASGYECGLNIEKYNDIKVGDIIEGFVEKEVARTL